MFNRWFIYWLLMTFLIIFFSCVYNMSLRFDDENWDWYTRLLEDPQCTYAPRMHLCAAPVYSELLDHEGDTRDVTAFRSDHQIHYRRSFWWAPATTKEENKRKNTTKSKWTSSNFCRSGELMFTWRCNLRVCEGVWVC